MSEIDTGGPAFPVTACTDPGDAGMTLRDWFAGQALAPYIAVYGTEPHSPDVVAANAYSVADAMLKARKRTND